MSVYIQVIMPNTACDGANATRLYKLIGDQFPTSNLVTVQRRYFNETKGELCVASLYPRRHVNSHILYFTKPEMCAVQLLQSACVGVCVGCVCSSLQACSTSDSSVSPSSTV